MIAGATLQREIKLGFLREACDGLARAAALAPNDPAVARTMEDMECPPATAPAWSLDHGVNGQD